MRKMITPYLHSPRTEHQKTENHIQMSPSDEIVKKILQFAASYRVEKVPESDFVDYFLN